MTPTVLIAALELQEYAAARLGFIPDVVLNDQFGQTKFRLEVNCHMTWICPGHGIFECISQGLVVGFLHRGCRLGIAWIDVEVNLKDASFFWHPTLCGNHLEECGVRPLTSAPTGGVSVLKNQSLRFLAKIHQLLQQSHLALRATVR